MFAMSLTTNLSLLDAMRGGRDQRAWQEFFCAYAPLLAGFARRLGLGDADAADAVQETLLAVHATFKTLSEPFDRSKGRFKAWLRGIAWRKVRDVQRRRARAGNAAIQLVQTPASDSQGSSGVDEQFELEWHQSLLARALKRVANESDPVVFQAFELYTLHEQPPEKVAKLLGVTRNAVYISKTRILQRLRGVLAELIEQEG